MVKVMSEEERLQLENELLLTCSKAQAINKYIDELEENSKLSELWCKSQQENNQLKEQMKELKHIMYVIRDDNGLNHLWCKDMILNWLGSDNNE